MIDLYYWPTPNGHKITLLLEEAGLAYTIKPVDIGSGAQFEPAFLAIAPNNRIPAIVDHAPRDTGVGSAAPLSAAPLGATPLSAAPISVFESGAILHYLADKCGRFLPTELRARTVVMEWLFWQVGGLGPMLGQNHHFNRYAPDKIPYAIDRYVRETARLYGVLDTRLRDRAFIAGDEYTIADMACYPWIVPHEAQQQNLDDFPDLKRWFASIAARPATVRAYALGERFAGPTEMSEQTRAYLFGGTRPPRD